MFFVLQNLFLINCTVFSICCDDKTSFETQIPFLIIILWYIGPNYQEIDFLIRKSTVKKLLINVLISNSFSWKRLNLS